MKLIQKGKILNLENYIIDEISYLEKMRNSLTRQLSAMPEGYLKINHSATGAPRFYHMCANEQGEKTENYISKRKNLEKAQRLASKNYYQNLLLSIDSELNALNDFKANFHPDSIENCYQSLSPERKNLVAPYQDTVASKVQEFMSLPHTPSTYKEEELTHETDSGEMVRSKSECFIANYLLANSDRFYFRYEHPLFLPKSRKNVYPDFTVINKRTGVIKYIEHAGMMDDPDYVDHFIKKINTYIENDIMPGRDLMISYESSSNHLVNRIFRLEFEDFMSRM